MNGKVRQFESGATRDTDEDKLNYRRCMDYSVMRRFAEYMFSKKKMPDGTIRPEDNWKKGFGRQSLMESMWRHFMDVYGIHEGKVVTDSRTGEQIDAEEALCGLLFNVQGYLLEVLKEREQCSNKSRNTPTPPSAA